MCVNDSVTAAPVNEPRCQPSVVSTPATITNRRGDVDKSLKCVSECWRRYVVYRATRCDTECGDDVTGQRTARLRRCNNTDLLKTSGPWRCESAARNESLHDAGRRRLREHRCSVDFYCLRPARVVVYVNWHRHPRIRTRSRRIVLTT